MGMDMQSASAQGMHEHQHALFEQQYQSRVAIVRKFVLACVIGIGFILIEFASIYLLDLGMVGALMLGVVIVVAYAIILFFLLEPKILPEVRTTHVQTVDRPVVREVMVDRPVIHEVIKEVDRPVIQEVIRTVEKPIYIETKPVRAKQKRYKYVGSITTKVYHYSTSRLARLIRPKNRVYGNNPRAFTRRGFKPAKNILKREKKQRKTKSKR